MPSPLVPDKSLYQAGFASQFSVASASTDDVLVNANPARKGLMIYNDSTAILYVLFDNNLSGGQPKIASTTNYSVQIGANGGFFEFPPIFVYTGIIKGIWASANGNARITEFS